AQVVGVALDRVVAVGRPVAVPVAALVDGDRVPAAAPELRRGTTPRVPRLAAAGEQQDRRRRGAPMSVRRQAEATRRDETDRTALSHRRGAPSRARTPACRSQRTPRPRGPACCTGPT